MVTLTVYGRPECHLCDEMLSGLAVLKGTLPAQGFDFSVDYIDIDASDELRAIYGKRIPVLKYAGEEICQYFLDTDKLLAALKAS